MQATHNGLTHSSTPQQVIAWYDAMVEEVLGAAPFEGADALLEDYGIFIELAIDNEEITLAQIPTAYTGVHAHLLAGL